MVPAVGYGVTSYFFVNFMQGYTLFSPLAVWGQTLFALLKIWGNLVIPNKKTRGVEPTNLPHLLQTIFPLGFSGNALQKSYSHSRSCVILKVTIHKVIDYTIIGLREM